MAYFKELISEIKKRKNMTKKQINSLKHKLSKKYKEKIPTDIEVLLHAIPKDIPRLKSLQTKPTRSISGVSVCAIMSFPYKCPHGRCIMCPGNPDEGIPQSYTGKEPATMRGIRNNFDPYLQVMNRLEQYVVLGHNFDKIELIIMGGTFPSFPKKYQENFAMYAFKAMNDFSKLFFDKNKFNIPRFKKFFELPGEVGSKKRTKSIQEKLRKLKAKNKTILEKEQKKNENSNVRCVGLTIETRPDYGKLKHGNEMLWLGCTRVELGVQSVYDNILKKIERGHTVKDSIESTQILKDLGFKINYHLMPGLPGVDYKKDLQGLKEIFKNQNFRPDMLKIYPCMVMKGTKLYDLWKKGKYKPLTTEKAAKLIVEFKKFIPEYCRVMRVQRDIPTYMTAAGVDRTNLRQYIEHLNVKCNCIRCREVGHVYQKHGKTPEKVELLIKEYNAGNGKEFFISFEDVRQNILLGFCRLRFPSKSLRKEITENSAIIRELHVYGEAVALGQKGLVQHKGLGKKLLKKAEEIAKNNKKKKMVVISAVGVKDYYRKLGYRKEGVYMIKVL